MMIDKRKNHIDNIVSHFGRKPELFLALKPQRMLEILQVCRDNWTAMSEIVKYVNKHKQDIRQLTVTEIKEAQDLLTVKKVLDA